MTTSGPRGRLRRRRTAPATPSELLDRLGTLRAAPVEVAAGDDVHTVLRRIVARVGAAGSAAGHLLVVAAPDGGAPLVHSAGLPAPQAHALVASLLAGVDPGPDVIVVDVASARRSHGRLAAVRRPGEGALELDRDVLAVHAGHAAATLDLLVATADVRRETARTGALLALAAELARATDAAAVCTAVAEAVPRVVGADHGALLLWEPAAGALVTAAVAGRPGGSRELTQQGSLRAEDTPELVGLLTDHEARVLDAATCSPRVAALLETLGLTHVVAVPLLAGRTLLGVATASWTAGSAPARLDGDVLALLRGVVDQASTALEKSRLVETVAHQATHDALTGLPNRVLFLDRLGSVLATTGPDQHAGVLFCDLDRFTSVNASRGHAAGDELLRRVAARLRAAVRPGDTVGRLGGDEFAVLLTGLTRPEDADRVVGRVLGCFERTFRLDGAEVAVGTSIGVAVHTGEGGVADVLLSAAHAAMDRHKHVSRDGLDGLDAAGD
ncbi:diguanylate cyclase domain-containing protein [Geodermatophilus sabuli]|uniref:diguanylate cyclase domain-containing protein n=1 Tax=Geodermatophilus sabuli TaxID=1564158 RepID=UPI0031F2ECF0